MAPASHAWRRLGAVAPTELVGDRLVLHRAVQLIASVGQALVKPRPDDSHRSMRWNEAGGAFEGETSDDGLEVVLEVAPFRLLLRGGSGTLGHLDLHGRTLTQARTWLADRLESARGGARPSLVWPEYELPPGMPAPDRALTPRPEALDELARWYQDGFSMLAPVVEANAEASAIRCWPHHFDLATLLTFEGPGGEPSRHVGIGLSPGDDSYAQPYVYVNGWPPPEPGALPGLEGPGRWHTRGWVGAVLRGEDVVEAWDADAQRDRVTAFLTRAVAAMKDAVLPG